MDGLKSLDRHNRDTYATKQQTFDMFEAQRVFNENANKKFNGSTDRADHIHDEF